MAQIRMDMSEYKSMEKNATLLKESLEKERELSERIEQLNEERLKDLRNAANHVTITEHSSKTETLQVMRHPEEIVRALEPVFHRHFQEKTHNYGGDPRHGYGRGNYPSSHLLYNLEYLAETFFKKVTIEIPGEKKVHRKGFDQVTKEIREEFFENLSLDTRIKLQEFDTQLKTISDLKLELVDLKKNLNKANASLLELNEFVDTESVAVIDLKFLLKDVEIFMDSLLEIIQGKVNIFRIKKFKIELVKTIKSFKKSYVRRTSSTDKGSK